MSEPLLYQGTAVVMAEVPDEISLAFNIAGCQHKCKGCHSTNLWEYKGKPLSDNFEQEISKHPGISCVCFMGGDQNQPELTDLCIKAHELGLKTCVWFGIDDANDIDVVLLQYLDYFKIGSWIEELGPLKSKTTNQRMYKVTGIAGHRNIQDITWRFQREYL